MANPRFNVSHRRLLAAAALAVLAVSACQGPAESQQTGRVWRTPVAHHMAVATGSHRA